MLVEEAEIAFIKKELCDYPQHAQLLRRGCSIAKMSAAYVDRCGHDDSQNSHRAGLKPFGSSLALCRIRPDIRLILAVMDADHIPLFPDRKTALLAHWVIFAVRGPLPSK